MGVAIADNGVLGKRRIDNQGPLEAAVILAEVLVPEAYGWSP